VNETSVGQDARSHDRQPEMEAALAARYDDLSPAQRRVIDRLLADHRYAATASARTIARDLGVAGSVVTRAAQTLGYEGFPDFQGQLRERFMGSLPQRVERTITDLGDGPETAGLRVMLEDIESLRDTVEDLSAEKLHQAVEVLTQASRVHVFGTRGSHGLAEMLVIGLRFALPGMHLLSQAAGDLPDQLVLFDANDALVVISFRRVDRAALAVLHYAKERGLPVIGVTDHLSSPIARGADIAFIAHARTLRLLPPFAAGASIVTALTTAVSLHKRADAAPRQREAEHAWEAFDAFIE